MPFLAFLPQSPASELSESSELPQEAVSAELRPPVPAPEPKRPADDAGMSTAEYAVGTVAAVAFAGVLYAVVSSSKTRDIISSVVERALAIPF